MINKKVKIGVVFATIITFVFGSIAASAFFEQDKKDWNGIKMFVVNSYGNILYPGTQLACVNFNDARSVAYFYPSMTPIYRPDGSLSTCVKNSKGKIKVE